MSYTGPSNWGTALFGKSKVVAPPNTNAKATSGAQAQLEAQMVAWGMPPELAKWAWNTYLGLGVTSVAEALPTIQAEIVKQPAFVNRFPAYAALAKQGDAWSPAQMIAYEDQAKSIFHAAGFPPDMYDTPGDLAPFMTGHVSTNKLQQRVTVASAAAMSAPDVRQEMETLYGIPDAHGALTAYWFNPEKALPTILQQFAGAQIGAQAMRTGVGQLSADQATHLAQIGVSDAAAAQGFGQLGAERGLFQQQVTGEDQIGLDTQIGAQFDNSAAAQERIRRRQQARLADFAGNAGEQLTAQGVSGLGRADRSA